MAFTQAEKQKMADWFERKYAIRITIEDPILYLVAEVNGIQNVVKKELEDAKKNREQQQLLLSTLAQKIEKTIKPEVYQIDNAQGWEIGKGIKWALIVVAVFVCGWISWGIKEWHDGTIQTIGAAKQIVSQQRFSAALRKYIPNDSTMVLPKSIYTINEKKEVVITLK